MAQDPQQLAKSALIAYRQLSEILKGGDIGVATAGTLLESYNRILGTLRECFSFDEAFTDSIKHLKPLGASDLMDTSFQMESDGKILLATAHSFIELYLSDQDKKKAIGFHT